MAEKECLEMAHQRQLRDCRDRTPAHEQAVLIDFCYRIGSYSCTSEPGIADDIDTRQDAELLMSLMSSRAKLTTAEKAELVSSSSDESEASFERCSVVDSRPFCFTCPSLSLESTGSLRSAVPTPLSTPTRRVSNEKETFAAKNRATRPPAELLCRGLKVEDRYALRLSADAVARNLLQSFQKAIQWRVQAWKEQCFVALARREQELRSKAAAQSEIKALLDSPEARLVHVLGIVGEQIRVVGARTAFPVLETSANEDGLNKRRRLSDETSFEYQAKYQLLLDCVISLDSPVGFSEIALEVPGSVQGTFVSSQNAPGELTSVTIDLDTAILAAMMERGCRKIVRASVEHVFAMDPGAAPAMKTLEMTTPTDFVSPPRTKSTGSQVKWSNIVTPRHYSTETHPVDSSLARCSLFPIPDNIDTDPRRISPQPNSPSFAASTSFELQTPKLGMSAPSLVSPPLNDMQDYREVTARSPSLPMLVEVACRAMQAN